MTAATTHVIEVTNLTKKFGRVTALDHVNVSILPNTIYGLLGRNGAGKTTLMSLLTGLDFPSAGSVLVNGQAPAENRAVLQQMCFIKESQRYPEGFTPQQVLTSARLFYPNWEQSIADELVQEFRVPLKTDMKKLSRGQLSAVGVILGLASRAPITLFDEPYLGLDAVARHLFYDRLLADYAEHPRTIILSTHLIDEVANLLEHVLVIDRGRILIDQNADDVRGTAFTVVGKSARVESFTAGRTVLSTERIGGLASVTVSGHLDPDVRREAAENDLEIVPVSLQELIVRLTETEEGKAA